MRKTTTLRKPGVGWLRALRVLSTLLAIAWSMRWAATASAADATEQAVLAAHEKRRDATLAGDAAAVGSMMTDDLTFTHANAVVETKAEFLDALKIRRYQYKSLTDEERGVRVHGDTGIVSGTCRIVVTAAGNDIDIRVRFTELWVKEGGAWQMVLWHATNVP
jgi:ketosteroid isomerase-like protein